MSTPTNEQIAGSLVTSFSSLVTKIKQLTTTNAQAAEAARLLAVDASAAAADAKLMSLDSEKLGGFTLSQVIETIAGASGLTILQVQQELQAFVARVDNPHGVTAAQVGLGDVQNFGIASAEEAVDSDVDNKYMTPAKVATALAAFWAEQVGAAPATLDTIQELAAALQDNPDVIQSLQDLVASKASTATLEAEVLRLEGLISAAEPSWATSAEAIEGTSTNTAISPATLKAVVDGVETRTNDTFTALEQAIADALADLNA